MSRGDDPQPSCSARMRQEGSPAISPSFQTCYAGPAEMSQESFHLPNSLTELGSLGGAASVPPTLLPFFFGATSASSDGGVIAGHSLTPRDGIHAFRWSQATGMADLGAFGSLGVNNRSN